MPNVPSEFLEKQLFSRISVACGRSQENNFEKSSSRQENSMALKDELGPKPRQKSAYNVPSEFLENQPFSRISVACSCSQENNVEKSSSRQENTMALKDELVPKPRQKSA